jgi:hypothetical protein
MKGLDSICRALCRQDPTPSHRSGGLFSDRTPLTPRPKRPINDPAIAPPRRKFVSPPFWGRLWGIVAGRALVHVMADRLRHASFFTSCHASLRVVSLRDTGFIPCGIAVLPIPKRKERRDSKNVRHFTVNRWRGRDAPWDNNTTWRSFMNLCSLNFILRLPIAWLSALGYRFVLVGRWFEIGLGGDRSRGYPRFWKRNRTVLWGAAKARNQQPHGTFSKSKPSPRFQLTRRCLIKRTRCMKLSGLPSGVT